MENLKTSFNYKFISIAFLFLAVLAIVLLFLYPLFDDLKAAQKNVEQKRAEIERERKYLSDLEQAKARLANYQEEIFLINAVLPDSSSLPSLLNDIQKISSESGLILRKVEPFEVSISDYPFLEETDFEIEVFGSYASFKNFLISLERSARLVRLENIYFLSEEEENLFPFQLTIKAYSFIKN